MPCLTITNVEAAQRHWYESLDGEAETPEQSGEDETGGAPEKRNRLSVRIREVYLEKAVLPASNKFSTRNREIYPAECRSGMLRTGEIEGESRIQSQ
jgi:hypothetical protein